jgi:xanthine dehydrogenase small subunit
MGTAVNSQTSETAVRFVLDGAVISESRVKPTTTVLQYLRENLHRPGSKEGCAEGDCGACTVVVGELREGRVHLYSVNACIQLLPMLHGKALFTVESLKSLSSAALHPVQQAMVDNHGSQCGFCTPGFVMSLFALFKQQTSPDRAQINDALSGNLCRCTGYRPIIQAAEQMSVLAHAKPGGWIGKPGTAQLPIEDEEQQLVDLLSSIQSSDTLTLKHEDMQYFAPASVDALAEIYAEHPSATLVAGNTDVGLWINKQLRELPIIVSLARVADLQTIRIDQDAIHIAAGVSVSDAFAAIQQYYPELQDLFRRFASMPVRNAATLVGNVANGSPIGDSMPILIALQSELLLRQGSDQRTLALDEFYLGYQKKDLREGEFVQSLRIPLNTAAYQVASYKVSKRFDQDISAVCAAFVLGLDDTGKVEHIRIAYGGMAAIPARAAQCEAALQGKHWDQASVDGAIAMLSQDFSPLSDMRASSEYRQRVAENLLQRFYLQTQNQQSAISLQLSELEQVIR